MDLRISEVREVQARIQAAKLPHPAEPLLEAFVADALDQAHAARYLRSRLETGDASSIVADWRYIIESITSDGHPPPRPDKQTRSTITARDGNRCCLTGKESTFWDPLVVIPVLLVPLKWNENKAHIFEMLGAFFGQQYREWWLSYVRNYDFTSPYRNHWLVRRSAAKPFAAGLLCLERLHPSMIEYKIGHTDIGTGKLIDVDGSFPLLGDHSRTGLEKVDPRFIGTHARLCRSIQYVALTKQLAARELRSPQPLPALPRHGHPSYPKRSFLATAALRAFLAIWLIIPTKLRLAIYHLGWQLGERLYGKPGGHATVQRLPFGLFLKSQGELEACRNEFNSLRTIRQLTTIPVPDPLDMAIPPGKPDDPYDFPRAYLLMTHLPGWPLSRCLNILSDRDCEQISNQLQDYIAQLRDIPKSVNPDKAICNTLGAACLDHRIQGGQAVGPFKDEAAFSQELRFSDEPSRRGHKIVFTHADLNPRNILVGCVASSDGSSRWFITGIVDWETSGYFPEYWDFTKAMFEGFRWPRRYNDMINKLFMHFGEYSQEYEVEKRSWESGDGV